MKSRRACEDNITAILKKYSSGLGIREHGRLNEPPHFVKGRILVCYIKGSIFVYEFI